MLSLGKAYVPIQEMVLILQYFTFLLTNYNFLIEISIRNSKSVFDNKGKRLVIINKKKKKTVEITYEYCAQ